MKERPIIFSGAMVRAILAGAKTQTRRVIKPQPTVTDEESKVLPAAWNQGFIDVMCPYGLPGDRLWARERLSLAGPSWHYAADDAPIQLGHGDPRVPAMLSWAHHNERDYCPSIYMPRWASRITLELTGVRVERLVGITEADAHSEGIEALDGSLDELALCRRAKQLGGCPEDARTWYAELWDQINGKRQGCSWADNPWVWRLEFRRIEASA